LTANNTIIIFARRTHLITIGKETLYGKPGVTRKPEDTTEEPKADSH